MKVSDEMVERMCHAYHDAVSRNASAPWNGMRAAIEAALQGCETKTWEVGPFGLPAALYVLSSDGSLIGKRVALVPLDD